MNEQASQQSSSHNSNSQRKGFGKKVTKNQQAQVQSTARLDEKKAELSDIQEQGRQLELIKLSHLIKNPVNSRRLPFSEIEMKEVITKQFGVDYDPNQLPNEFEEFDFAKSLLGEKTNTHSQTISFFEGIIKLAKSFANEHLSPAKIPAIDVMKMRSGELMIQAGHRRFYGATIAKKPKIASNPVVNEEDFSKTASISSNLNENLGQEELLFSDKVWALANALESTAQQLQKPASEVKRAEFLRINSLELKHVKNIYPQLANGDVAISLAKQGVFKSEKAFRNFIKGDTEQKIAYLKEFDFADLVPLLYEEAGLDDYTDIMPEQKKNRNRKVTSYALPKIKDASIGKAVLSALLNHESFSAKKDYILGSARRIPATISEQAEIMERINEVLKEGI